MPAHRKNFDAAIELYGLGASIEDVADAYGVSRQAMWKALSRRGVAMRPRIRFDAGNHFFVHGEGYGSEKVAAKIEVMKAIRAGRLTRQPCERCGESPTAKDGRSLVHAHHEDYSKPLHVRWLCVSCHYAEHH
ncbi:hypothetical protein [Burkholderia multivorans]|uniref:hypothetical protein n=1 Tax=Burkholderia multivorans TaxID=87883 RepID=UPI0011B26EDB|nr:hypothetical protein [Burkholderia multivorans]MBU9211858.1 hypothetical protein [Burkholderia multivorans]MBU9592717.1 hypothetical protein [Burkholderia multivorans]MBU9624730.1 hypothetical protein [Burkholderia multivorans]MCA8251538.1 hypothetical protein [Burkholderia multivorans]QGR60396.1 hypothetical protein FOC27_09265 [Burkholderia multivorans]